MDQPTNDGVNTYFVSKAAREAGLTVVLSGLGGDEVFWGYRHYQWLNGGRAAVAGAVPGRRRGKALSRGAALWGRVRGQRQLDADGFLESARLEPGALSADARVLRAASRDGSAGDRPARPRRRRRATVRRPVPPGTDNAGPGAFNHIEFKRYLHDQLLRDTDVFSMAHSIEVRVPFLDHPLVEHAAGVQPALKMANEHQQAAAGRRGGRCSRAESRRGGEARLLAPDGPLDEGVERRTGGDGHVGQHSQPARGPRPVGSSFARIASTGRARGR